MMRTFEAAQRYIPLASIGVTISHSQVVAGWRCTACGGESGGWLLSAAFRGGRSCTVLRASVDIGSECTALQQRRPKRSRGAN
jgi:hypothetical protein